MPPCTNSSQLLSRNAALCESQEALAGPDEEVIGLDSMRSFKSEVVRIILEHPWGSNALREFLRDPLHCPIHVNDIMQLEASVGRNMRAYSSAHFLDERFRHVCRRQPCKFEHPGVHPVCMDEASGYLKPLVPDMHLLVNRYLKPWTVAHNVSYGGALIINRAADCQTDRMWSFSTGKMDKLWKKVAASCRASVFVSHDWRAVFSDFVETVSNTVAFDDRVWVCAFAVNQNTAIGETLGEDVLDSPFARALKLADRVFVIVDSSASTLDRVWCVLEAHLALQAKKPFSIAAPPSFGDADWHKVQSRLRTLDVRRAEASVGSDKEKIMRSIKGQEEFINKAVQQRAMVSCHDGIVMNAARRGAVEQLQLVPRPLCADAGKNTALHYAAQAAAAQGLEWLLALQADLHARNVHGESALHHAALSQTGATITPLVVVRAEVETRDASRFGWTPLLKAAYAGSDAAVRQLLNHRANLGTPTRLVGLTPLHVAAQAGHRKVVRILLDARADHKSHAGHLDINIDFPTLHCGTPLHHAARNGHCSVIHELLASRATVEVGICSGSSKGAAPLHCAAVGGHLAATQALIHSRAAPGQCTRGDLQPLHCAAVQGSSAVAQVLLEARAGVDTPVTSWLYRGMQPLHRASLAGHAAVAQVLLKARASPSAQLTSWILGGLQPMQIAAFDGHSKVVEMLLEAHGSANAEVSAWVLRGQRALHVATMYGHDSVLQILLEARAEVGAELTSVFYHGRQPLHNTARSGSSEGTRKLLEARAEVGAKITARHSRGCQPIHQAVYHNRTGLLRVLLEARAEVGVQATVYMKRYRGAMQVAMERGHRAAMNLLLQHKAES